MERPQMPLTKAAKKGETIVGKSYANFVLKVVFFFFSPNVVYQFSQPLNEQEMEEQRRQAEGVDALLNLAGYNTNTTLLLKRPASAEDPQKFEKKQYFYTTEIAPSTQYHTNEYYMDEPPSKKPKSRILRNKLKKRSCYR